MLKHGLVFSLVMAMASVATAGDGGVIGVSLSSDSVLAGEVINAEVSLTGDDADHYLRLVQYDFSLSDVGHQNFDFKYNSGFCDALPDNCGSSGYAELNLDGDVPATVFPGLSQDVFSQILLPGDGSAILSATFDIDTTGLAVNDPLDPYVVDVLNVDTPDDNFGARVDFGFGNGDPITTWSAFNGLLTGGSATFNVVPEPASLALLGLGAVAVLRRRR